MLFNWERFRRIRISKRVIIVEKRDICGRRISVGLFHVTAKAHGEGVEGDNSKIQSIKTAIKDWLVVENIDYIVKSAQYMIWNTYHAVESCFTLLLPEIT